MNRRKAFTLVELLVVIAIIALLMAILMPALNRVREQGRMVKCLANMKQWNLIAAMYTEENQGKFWPSDAGTQCYWWIKYIEDKYKDWKTNKLWFCPSAQKPQTDERGVTTPVLNIYNAWGIYKGTGLGPNGIAGSIGINGYVLIPYPPVGGATTYEPGVSVQNGWKTAGAAGSNNIPLFTEGLRFDFWPTEDQAPSAREHAAWEDASRNNMTRICINRHQGFISMAFLDFSARKVGLKELWRLKWHRTFNTSGPWTTTGGRIPAWPNWMKSFPEY